MNYEEFKENYVDLKQAGFWTEDEVLPVTLCNFDPLDLEGVGDDMVNSPEHYTQGKQEAIVTIEDAISSAPGPITGLLQGNALKYLIRLWSKSNALQDAKKARWYLDRLIARLEGEID